MAPRSRDPTNAQLSARLRYAEGAAPAFLARMRAQVAGHAYDGEDDPAYEFEDVEGREAIPRRPAVPVRPDDGEGVLDENDGEDEAPQVVVLREGKHLSGREVENERRKAKGLSPLPDEPALPADTDADPPAAPASKTPAPNLAGVSFGGAKKPPKRKAVGDDASTTTATPPADKEKKKAKKQKKTLLSFGDDA